MRRGDGVALIGGDAAIANELADIFDALFARRFHIGKVGDGGPVTVNNTDVSAVVTVAGKAPTADNLKRFLVGPKGAEITGIDMTPDRKALFVNIQHPGESGGFSNYSQTSLFTEQSSFNALELTAGSRRARSVTLVITKDDGGEIAV